MTEPAPAGPLAGSEGAGDGRARPGAARRADFGRVRRRRAPHRAAPGRPPLPGPLAAPRPRPAWPRRPPGRPEAARRRRPRRRAGIRGRRDPRRLPAGRDGAPGPRPRAADGSQSAPRLWPHDGFRPRRAAGRPRRPRPDLPRLHRHPGIDRPSRRPPVAAAQPRRRLWRRRHAAPGRRAGGAVRAFLVGPWPGRRRRHGRRRIAARRAVLRLPRRRPLAGAPRRQPARFRRPLLRHLRDRRRALDGRRLPGAALLRRVRTPAAARRRPRRAPVRPPGLAGHAGGHRRPLRRGDAGRVGRPVRGRPTLAWRRCWRFPRRLGTRTAVAREAHVEAAGGLRRPAPAPRLSRTPLRLAEPAAAGCPFDALGRFGIVRAEAERLAGDGILG